MIAQQGMVVDTREGEATVRVGRSSGCAACDAGKGCGAGIFGRLIRSEPVEITVPNRLNARSGQAVDLGIPESDFLILVFRLYGLPILAGLAGAGIGWWSFGQYVEAPLLGDLVTLASGAATAGLALRTNRIATREFPRYLTVHLIRVLDSPAALECGREY